MKTAISTVHPEVFAIDHPASPTSRPSTASSYQDHVDPDLPQALASLSAQQRQAVVLVHVNGLTYSEAADALGVDVSTVRTHVSRALDRLRRILKEVDS